MAEPNNKILFLLVVACALVFDLWSWHLPPLPPAPSRRCTASALPAAVAETVASLPVA
jgi:hypothetical protein